MKYIKLSKSMSISEVAYATIVYYALKEVEGVYVEDTDSLSQRTLKNTVDLEVLEDGIIININACVLLQHNIESIAKNIQENVYDTILQSVGFEPIKVNVEISRVVKEGSLWRKKLYNY